MVCMKHPLPQMVEHGNDKSSQKTGRNSGPTKTYTGSDNLKTDIKGKNSEGSGMETDQAEQLD